MTILKWRITTVISDSLAGKNVGLQYTVANKAGCFHTSRPGNESIEIVAQWGEKAQDL